MNQRGKGTTVFLVAAACLIVGFCVGYVAGLNDPGRSGRSGLSASGPPALPAAASSSPALALDAASVGIIDKLNCVCGCKMKLATCTCEDARGSKEIKTAVQDLVNQKLPEADILKKLEEKYGKQVKI